MLERCQLEPLRLEQCQHQQRPGTGTGEQTATAHRLHRVRPGAAVPPRQRRPKARAAAHTAPPALAFFFCPSSSYAACPACRISNRPARPDDHAARTMTTPAQHHRSRSPRPPAPHTSGRPAPAPAAAPMTPQPISCTACPLPTASSQQPAAPDLTAASASRLHLPAAPANPAALPPACRSRSAPPTTAKRPKTSPPRPAAGGVRFFTFPAYRLCSIAVS